MNAEQHIKNTLALLSYSHTHKCFIMFFDAGAHASLCCGSYAWLCGDEGGHLVIIVCVSDPCVYVCVKEDEKNKAEPICYFSPLPD